MKSSFKLILIFIFFLGFRNFINAQTTGGKVYSEGGENSPVEQELENGLNQKSGISANYSSARKNIGLAYDLLKNATSQAEIDRAFQLVKQAQAEANMARAAENTEREKDGRQAYTSSSYKEIHSSADLILNYGKDQYKRDMENRLKQADFHNTKAKHDNSLKEMDAEIFQLKKKNISLEMQISDLDKELRALNTGSSNKSIDDFLVGKGNNSVQDDFLVSDNNSGGNDDFLSGSSQSNSDFLLANKKEEFVIDKKDNGTQGVKTKSGKLLIPYKKWEIVEYKNGIAKVKTILEERKFDCAEAWIYKTGYVDIQGEYLDGFEVLSDKMEYIDDYQGVPILLTPVNSGPETARRMRAQAERERKIKAAEAEEKRNRCIAAYKSWAIQRIKYYR